MSAAPLLVLLLLDDGRSAVGSREGLRVGIWGTERDLGRLRIGREELKAFLSGGVHGDDAKGLTIGLSFCRDEDSGGANSAPELTL